ncbi:hypothetical protein ACA910_001975 [Epithemia clementina (nom. ined.)]
MLHGSNSNTSNSGLIYHDENNNGRKPITRTTDAIEEEGENQIFSVWKIIYVLYGAAKHLQENAASGSQVGQDTAVMHLLNEQRNGFFLDLAASDATEWSYTYQSEKQLDWNKICVEQILSTGDDCPTESVRSWQLWSVAMKNID